MENTSTLPPRDIEGYMFNPDNWNEDIANKIANEEGIELTDSLWLKLYFMRKYYDEHNIAPNVRHLISHLVTEGRCDKKEAKKIIFKLFPYGYVKQTCKIAGMKRPRTWSTG
jgi:tRNA 2-thiouridine synthesizing protein E